MSEDAYFRYEIGISELVRRIKEKGSPAFSEVLGYEDRLNHNIMKCRNFGETPALEAKREEIIVQLNRVSENELDISFNDICKEAVTGSHGDKVKVVPFVIIAMTRTEAENLLKNYQNIEPLNKFIISIAGKEEKNVNAFISLLIDRYAQVRNEWKPFNGETIRNLIEKLNSIKKHKTKFKLVPTFYESAFFSKDIEVYDEICEYFSKNDCVFVIDLISLFHPDIKEQLLQSQLARTKPIIGLSPISNDSKDTNQIIIDVIKEKLKSIYTRYQRKFDLNCMLEVHSPPALSHWLYNVLPGIIEKPQQPIPDNINKLRESTKHKVTGIETAVFSMGGNL